MNSIVIPEDQLRKHADADGITHLSTGVAVVRDSKILAIRRHPADYMGGYFEMPGGGIDPGETFEAAIRRELAEETGLAMQEVVAMFAGFDYATPSKPKVRQFNFLVSAKGDIALSNEHDAWQWVRPQDLQSLAMSDEQRQCFDAAFAVLESRLAA